MSYIMGLDLGQASDFTALVILEEQPRREGEALLLIRHLHRFALATSYPTVAAYVAGLLGRPPLYGATDLVVDATGVGRPVVDLLRRYGCSPVAVTITGGDSVAQDEGGFRVPKRDLVMTVATLLQEGRLKAAEVPGIEILKAELLNFRIKINALTGHDSYGAGPASAWREGEHDDLVLSVALGCWYGAAAPGRLGAGWPAFARRGREGTV